MFPDRVGRVVLDGVVDADLYVSPIWSDSIQDSDKILKKFHQYCFEAGSKCALYRDGDKAEDIEVRFEGVMSKLKESPISFIQPQTITPVVLHYSDIRVLIFSVLYFPSTGFPTVATLIDVLYRGKEEEIRRAVAVFGVNSGICQIDLPDWMYPGDAQYAIMCSDKRYHVSKCTHLSLGIYIFCC